MQLPFYKIIGGKRRSISYTADSSVSYFRKVCPPYKQHVYTLKTEATPQGELELVGDGQTRIHQLQMLLAASDSGCVRIEGTVFDDQYVSRLLPASRPGYPGRPSHFLAKSKI
jgi:hypothetical protein